jgi:hypothetical protein
MQNNYHSRRATILRFWRAFGNVWKSSRSGVAHRIAGAWFLARLPQTRTVFRTIDRLYRPESGVKKSIPAAPPPLCRSLPGIEVPSTQGSAVN